MKGIDNTTIRLIEAYLNEYRTLPLYGSMIEHVNGMYIIHHKKHGMYWKNSHDITTAVIYAISP